MPTSFLLAEVSVSGTYRPQSATFFSDTPTPSLSWESTVSDYSGSQLNRAAASRVYRHRELADGMPRRIGELAVEITANQPAPYAKAKAIEQYLRTEYLYRLADPSGSGQPPSGHDPVDWFLFESRQGTCGNFSSAFVALARAVGLPARVVSGWAIAPMAGMQTVYADQAHQRAEIAFEGLGWVAFEPTPAESAPSRAAQYAAAAESKAAQESVETDSLVEGLTSGDADTQEKAREGLEQLGATVTEMENGASLVTKDGVAIGLATGTTSAQAKEPSTTPVFFVTGAENTGYLRTSVGDVYQNGVWQQLDPVTIGYEPPGSVPHLVRDEIDRPGGELASLPEWRVDPGLLARYETRPGITLTDTIHVRAAPDLGRIPAGAVPTSLSLDRVGGRGGFSPFSSTFQLAKSGDGYQWVSQVPHFSNAQLHSAQLAQDPTYTQLPDDIPERIGRLALEITQGHSSPYAKAKAIETYLNTHYAYSYSTGSANEPPPPEHDPADWFLFEYQEGTCGVFSTAFAVLARSVGIPARVVSGWSITPMAERQVVRLNQAHQWAEVAFEGLGWVSFEPTASGPPSRTAPRVDQGSSDQNQGSTGPDPQPVIVFETATAITEWPARVNRQTEFTVGGTVQTLSGRPVNGTEVEVFVNETKEHGGIKVGSAVTIDGQFRARVQIPSSMELGPYQLIAHAIENDRYLGSWSDPDFAVYSESGFELTGPIEIPVDVQAVFRGRLTEDTGGGVAGQQLQITVDDADVSSTKTGPAGDFSFGSIFTEPGAHWVEVEFEGREFLVGNSVRLELTATMPTQLDVNAPATVPVGEEFQITGVLQNIRGEPVEGEVSVTVGSGPSQSFQTGAAGEFETTLSFVESGVYLIAAEYMAEHPVLPSANSVRVVARHVTALTIDGPREIENGKGATFSGDVVSTTLSAIGPLRLLIADGEGNELATVSTETDGSFEYQEDSLDKTGPNVLTAVFAGEEFLTASSAAVAYLVLAPTKLSIDGPGLVRVGESPRWNGRLLHADGQPVPNASLQVGNGEGQVVLTGSDGGFSLDGGLEAAEAPSGSEIEVEVSIPVRFDGTDHLAAALAELRYTIGLPRVVVEPTESVARGEGLTLRGTALIGTRPAAGVEIAIGPEIRVESNEVGVFTHRYLVAADAPLGRNELAVDAPGIDAVTAVSIEVKSASRLIVTPVEDVRPGRVVMLHMSLLDDTGQGIPQATVRSSQGAEGLTDPFGVALIELAVPDTEGMLTVPVTLRFEGNARNMPLTYFLGVPITPSSFNWLLWTGMPALVVATVGAGYMGRRLGVPALLRQRLSPEPPDIEPTQLLPDEEPIEAEAIIQPLPTRLEIAFQKPAPGLAEVWGLGEEVPVRIAIFDDDGLPIAQASISAVAEPGEPMLVETGEDGACEFRWSANALGEFAVSADYSGDDYHLASSQSQGFRVVEFREEIVRLYNSFVEWGAERVPEISGQATPREVEALVVSSGVSVDQKLLDEVISRFEEADYSEHPITRRQYEAMYRAWRAVVED